MSSLQAELHVHVDAHTVFLLLSYIMDRPFSREVIFVHYV